MNNNKPNVDSNVKLEQMLESLTVGEYNSLSDGVQQAFDELLNAIAEYEGKR